MIVQFDKSFLKSLDKLENKKVKAKLIEVIELLENSISISSIASIKKLQGFKNFYRIRIGEYRLGFELIDEDTILLILIALRKDIYRKFP